MIFPMVDAGSVEDGPDDDGRYLDEMYAFGSTLLPLAAAFTFGTGGRTYYVLDTLLYTYCIHLQVFSPKIC